MANRKIPAGHANVNSGIYSHSVSFSVGRERGREGERERGREGERERGREGEREREEMEETVEMKPLCLTDDVIKCDY